MFVFCTVSRKGVHYNFELENLCYNWSENAFKVSEIERKKNISK